MVYMRRPRHGTGGKTQGRGVFKGAKVRRDEVLIEIRTLAVFAGKIPPRAPGLVMEWAMQHQTEHDAIVECCPGHVNTS